MADPKIINDYKKLLDDIKLLEKEAEAKGETLLLSEKEIEGIKKARTATAATIN